MSRIAIIGSGMVGTAHGLGLVQMGHHVIFHDINANRIGDLNKQGLNVSTDLSYAIKQSDISFVCVPTPYEDGINLRYVVSAIKDITNILRSNKRLWHLVVIKSTVVPLTTEKVLLPILEQYHDVDFGLCVNPEFLTEIATTWTDDLRFRRDFWSKERIVIGEIDTESGDVLEELYRPLGTPIFRTDLKTAEMTKYATNCMLATKISYWNEMFLICKNMGVDSHLVAEVTSLDARIGKYGTIHGKAFGGKCIPKDLAAFNKFAEPYLTTDLLGNVQDVNDFMAKEYGVRE